jgi:hypothetical protein
MNHAHFDVSHLKDLPSEPGEQRELASMVLGAEDAPGSSIEVTLYRARPRINLGAQTRLLGQRGPTGKIVGGEGKAVRAAFPVDRLRSWADAWLTAHGSGSSPCDPIETAFVVDYLDRFGLPAKYHRYFAEEVSS